MACKDLREWIDQVVKAGELVEVKGVHWDLELGAITELARERPQPRPAILFDEIAGYPPGYRILTQSLDSAARTCLTLNLEPEDSMIKLTDACRRKLAGLKPIPPRTVEEGPVMENVQRGKEINLFKFPAPRWHEHDGGRYLGTGSVTITRDPEEGWINLGTYRVMVHDEQTLGFYISPGKHARLHRDGYFNRGEACPVAISFGQDPLLFMVASVPLPYGVQEYDFAGGIKGEPIEVIKGPATGLPIPASAELVIEGEALPTEAREEGPFGEFTGYYGSGVRPEPFIRVKRVMHRNDPIILGSPPGRRNDYDLFHAIVRSALVWDQLEKAGVPDVKGVWMYQSRFLKVISIKQRYPGHARQAAVVGAQCHASAYMGRFIVVVDEDIDPSNIEEVLWAIGTRVDPENSIEIMKRCWSSPLDPIIPKVRAGFSSRAIIDACKPYEWINEFPASVGVSQELKERILKDRGKALRDKEII